MDNQNKIAQNFVDLHKDSNPENWQSFGFTNQQKLTSIYQNLISGMYGELKEETEGEYKIEISSLDREDKNPFIYQFTN